MATYKLIASSTVGAGGASSITFSSIPQTYTDLVIKYSLRSSRGGSSTYGFAVSFNSSSANTSGRLLTGNGSSAASVSFSGLMSLGNEVLSTVTANTFGNGELYIPNYAGSNNKSASVDNVTENNGTTAFAELIANLWANSAAITSITLDGYGANFVQYSSAYLYGVSNA